jgi:hypothetical protein
MYKSPIGELQKLLQSEAVILKSLVKAQTLGLVSASGITYGHCLPGTLTNPSRTHLETLTVNTIVEFLFE